ncbi:MAG: SCO family protein [Thiomicrorhabdus sp.]|nr:SCO family protein [Thiomicrorhabdus sp.]
MNISQKAVKIGIVAIGALLLLFFLFQFLTKPTPHSPPPPKGIVSEKPTGGNFTLTSINGQQSLSNFKDKLVLLYFGYTYCPDICPTDLGNLAMAYRGLNDQEKEQVQILFVTVDPERDTVNRMAEYTGYFDADMVGLTGTNAEIATVAKQYGVVYMKANNPLNSHSSAENYTVDHSAFTYIIDATGQLQTQLPHAMPPQQIQNTIQTYLTQDKAS